MEALARRLLAPTLVGCLGVASAGCPSTAVTTVDEAAKPLDEDGERDEGVSDETSPSAEREVAGPGHPKSADKPAAGGPVSPATDSSLRDRIEVAVSGSDDAGDARAAVVAAGEDAGLPLVLATLEEVDGEDPRFAGLLRIAREWGPEPHKKALRVAAVRPDGRTAIITLCDHHDRETLRLLLSAPDFGRAIETMAVDPKLNRRMVALMNAYALEWKALRRDVKKLRKGAEGDFAKFLDGIISAGPTGPSRPLPGIVGADRESARPPKPPKEDTEKR